MKLKNAFYTCYLGSLIVVAHFFSLFPTIHASCTFPNASLGEWFQSEVQTEERHIIINRTFFGTKGSCVDTYDDYFILENKSFYQCLLITLLHENVIQFRETYPTTLDPDSNYRNLCNDIRPDFPSLSMFRVNAKPISCPFSSPPFTFYYSRGDAACQNPPSRISACADDRKLLLHYSACTDVRGSESATEELTCVGKWKEGNSNYLVAKINNKNGANAFDAEKYKCCLYEPIMQSNVNTGYKIALSEASCSGLTSITDGSTIMTLTREEVRHTNCKFPSWITDQKSWQALNSGIAYHFNSSTALKISGDKKESKLVCHSMEKSEDLKFSYVVVKVISGCDVGYKCMLFQHRHSHIIEIQEAPNVEPSYQDVCSPERFDPSTLPLVTYSAANFSLRKCPFLPKLVTTSENRGCNDQGYQQVLIGCGSKLDKVEFMPSDSCPNMTTSEFVCHGHWEAKRINSTEDVAYIIASSTKAIDNNRYTCFSYTKKNDVYQLRATSPTCYESKALKQFTFQLKSDGQCRSSEYYPSGKRESDNDDDDSSYNSVNMNKCATLAVSAFHFFIAYLLSVYVR